MPNTGPNVPKHMHSEVWGTDLLSQNRQPLPYNRVPYRPSGRLTGYPTGTPALDVSQSLGRPDLPSVLERVSLRLSGISLARVLYLPYY